MCACNRFFPIFLKNNFSNVKCTVCSTSNPKTNNNNWIRNRAWSPLYQPCTTLLPFNIFQFVFKFFFKFHPIIRSISMASKRVFLFFLLKVSNVSFWPPPPIFNLFYFIYILSLMNDKNMKTNQQNQHIFFHFTTRRARYRTE